MHKYIPPVSLIEHEVKMHLKHNNVTRTIVHLSCSSHPPTRFFRNIELNNKHLYALKEDETGVWLNTAKHSITLFQ